MMKKGRKREDKGLAVAHFIIGLVMLLIILAAIYWTLVELDYSDKVRDPNATIRPYVQVTVAPSDAAINAFTPVNSEAPDAVDLTVPTPEPTATPVPTPVPTDTPEPTPEPTRVPEDLIAKAVTAAFTVPETPSENGVVAITESTVAQDDADNAVMKLIGYGYIDDIRFDATLAQSYIVVIPQSNPDGKAAYPVAMKKGVSGVYHADAKCQNAANGDFEVYFSLDDRYKDDTYALELAISFTLKGSAQRLWMFYPFDESASFAVKDGQVVPVEVSAPAGDAAPADDAAPMEDTAPVEDAAATEDASATGGEAATGDETAVG